MKIAHIKICGGQNDVVIAHGNIVVTEDSSTVVTFDSVALPHVPIVTVTPISNDPEHTASVDTVSTTGCTVYMNKTGGGAAGDITVGLIAVS